MKELYNHSTPDTFPIRLVLDPSEEAYSSGGFGGMFGKDPVPGKINSGNLYSIAVFIEISSLLFTHTLANNFSR